MTNKDSQDYPPLWFEVACIENNKIWFVAGFGNGLFELDLVSGETSFLGMIPREPFNLRRIIGSIVKVNNKLIMAPFNGNSFCEYDLENKTFKMIECKLEGNAKFFCGKYYKDNIYFIGCQIPVIAKFNVIKNTVEYYSDFKDDILNLRFRENEPIFRETACIEDDKLIIPSCQSNFVLIYDLIMHDYNIIKINDDDEGFNSIVKNEDVYILATRKRKKVILWDYKSNKSEVILDCSKGEFENMKVLGYTVKVNEKLFSVDIYTNNGFVFDLIDKSIVSIEKVISVDEKLEKIKIGQEALCLYSYNNKIYYLSAYGSFLYEIDLFNNTSRNIELSLNEDYINKYKEHILGNNIEIMEGIAYIGPKDLLKNGAYSNSVYKDSYGAEIHKYIKNKIV